MEEAVLLIYIHNFTYGINITMENGVKLSYNLFKQDFYTVMIVISKVQILEVITPLFFPIFTHLNSRGSKNGTKTNLL